MKLFTALTCAPCKTLKGMIKENGMSGIEYVDAMCETGSAQCQTYGIRSVPTLVTDDEEVITGIDEIISKLGL